MSRERFAFALEHLEPSQWELFENLASAFLAAEFSSLRTVATSSGDKGRDAELFSCDGKPTVMVQYSIAADWHSKIKDTITKITQNFPDVRVLVYVTNQKIGAKADELRIKTRDEAGLVLDIRDCEWYLDRYAIEPDREKVAEDFAKKIVDPLLADTQVIARHATALSDDEAKCAILYLQLQWEDDTREKGLTKTCFDALVKAALRGTDSESRITRSEVIRRVQAVVSSHEEKHVEELTNTALKRLNKKAIRHWTKGDEFCLSYEETQRVSEKLVGISNEDKLLHKVIESYLERRITVRPDSSILEESINLIRRVIEMSLLKRGELFAIAVNTGNFGALDLSGVREVAIAEISQTGAPVTKWLNLDMLIEISVDLLTDPEPEIMPCLRRLADAYTLLAFLQETPDVQSSIKKMFDYGEIWLDTSIILPLLAEDLIVDRTTPFTKMIISAREAGVDLFVTRGVIEEICAHINRCFAYHHSDTWQGRVPFLYAAQAINGSGSAGFTSWVNKFSSPINPQEDAAEYLEDFFGIKIQSLEDEVNSASDDVRGVIKERWLAIHEDRRQTDFEGGFDQHLAIRLAEHDVENYLGVLQRRKSEVGSSPFGYRSW